MPSGAERAALAQALVARAEAEYAAGRVEQAYRALQSALSAQDPYFPALDDLALVALKSGRLGVALEAASIVIASDVEPDMKARAWFNLGLACQKVERFTTYNGQYYCRGDRIDAFLQAWRLQPSAARKDKLKELFETNALRNCTVAGPGAMTSKYHFTSYSARDGDGGSTRVYVYHPSSVTIDPAQVSWRTATRPA